MNKDNHLMDLLKKIDSKNAHSVIIGDVIDLHQAWSISRIIKAHARLLSTLSRMASKNGVTYIWTITIVTYPYTETCCI